MKVCFITCHYPPLSRTLRRYQFARFLVDGGCQVEVVAHGNVSQALGAFAVDADILPEDPEIRVHRPRAFPWYLSGEVLYRLGAIPCPHLNWLLPAARAAARIATSAADRVLGLYPPLTNLLAAWLVSRRTGAKLVLDFRDEYLGLHRGVRRPWACWCERQLVSRAALISVATPSLAENLRQRYDLSPEKIHLTLNGYWQEVRGDLSLPARDQVRLVYVGALSPAQGLEVLCRAVRLLEAQCPQAAARFEGWIYGPDNFYLRRRLLPLLGGRLQYGGFLNAGKVSSVLLGGDVGFLSLASDHYSYAVPGKLFEYIAHARPILAALPSGKARELIEEEGFGLVARCGDPDELAVRLCEMLDRDRRLAFHRRLLERRHQYAARPYFLSLAKRLQELA